MNRLDPKRYYFLGGGVWAEWERERNRKLIDWRVFVQNLFLSLTWMRRPIAVWHQSTMICVQIKHTSSHSRSVWRHTYDHIYMYTCRRRGSSWLWVKLTQSLQCVIQYWLFLLKFTDKASIKATAEVFCVSGQHGGVSLNESTSLNESSESMIQLPIHKDRSHFARFWMND